LPLQAIRAAKGSIGGALGAAQGLQHAGLGPSAGGLRAAATGAFLHSLSGGLRLAGGVAAVGAVMAALLLPSRPSVPGAELAEAETQGEPVPAFEA